MQRATVIDYTKEKPSQALEAHSVDTLINVSGDALSLVRAFPSASVLSLMPYASVLS
jgi:hypothetical protein